MFPRFTCKCSVRHFEVIWTIARDQIGGAVELVIVRIRGPLTAYTYMPLHELKVKTLKFVKTKLYDNYSDTERIFESEPSL